MSIQDLNKRKNELFSAQEAILNAAQEAKRSLTDVENGQLDTFSNDIKSLDKQITMQASIAAGRESLAKPTSKMVVPGQDKVTAKGKQFSAEYHEAFWGQFANAGKGIYNAALGEGGTTDGGYLVPITVDGTIVPLMPLESVMRQLALVIPTSNDIKLPAQSAKTIAAAKEESRQADHAFAGTAPTFTQVTLSAYMAGVIVPVTLELAQDVPALEPFLNQDIQEGIVVFEEDNFVNGSGSGEPEGVLTGATAAQTAALSASAGLDLVGALNPRYYPNASFLMNRLTGIDIQKAQITDNQFNKYWTVEGKQNYFHGYPVFYSAAMPHFVASPEVDGAVVFGDFKRGMVIGDRGGSAIAVKVLDQTSIKNGVLDVLGYRRTDSRIRVSQALQMWTING